MSEKASDQQATKKQRTPYELIYWGSVPGRMEPIRLALEEAGADYIDRSRDGGEQDPNCLVVSHTSPDFKVDGDNIAPFACPILRHGDLLLSQSPNILLYLGPRLGLLPEDEIGRLKVNQLALTAMDWQSMAHEVHHPISANLFYEDQKPEAARAAADYRNNRCPQLMGYFERVLVANGTGFLVGDSLTYADFVLYHVVDGVRFAFPKAMAKHFPKYPTLEKHYKSIAERPNIKAYLASDRRKKFGEGIFRYYTELDDKE